MKSQHFYSRIRFHPTRKREGKEGTVLLLAGSSAKLGSEKIAFREELKRKKRHAEKGGRKRLAA